MVLVNDLAGCDYYVQHLLELILKWAYAFYCNIRTSDHDHSSDLFLQEFTDKEMWLHVTAISHEMKQQCRLQKPTPQH
jgi:hypothetical protein